MHDRDRVGRPVAKISSVLYPFAIGESGALVDIKDYTKGAAADCPGCGRGMTARQGRQKQWHFGHAVEPGAPPCSPESALHYIAKLLIRDSFVAAKQEGRPYPLRWPCTRCRAECVVDCTRHWASAVCEAQAARNVRSDVLFTGARPLI